MLSVKQLLSLSILCTISFNSFYAMEESSAKAPSSCGTIQPEQGESERLIGLHSQPSSDEDNQKQHYDFAFEDLNITGTIVPSLQQIRPNKDITHECGYYALYNTLTFLNMHINRLNRNQFCEFFGTALQHILELRIHGPLDNLTAAELRRLIQKIPATQKKPIAVLSISQLKSIAQGIMNIDEAFLEDHETLNLLRKFVDKGADQINSIAIIIGLGDQDGHWIALNATRNTDQKLTIQLADSISHTADWTPLRLDESILHVCILLTTLSNQWQNVFTELNNIIFQQDYAQDTSTHASQQQAQPTDKNTRMLQESHLNNMYTFLHFLNEINGFVAQDDTISLKKSLLQRKLNIQSHDLLDYLNQLYDSTRHPAIRETIDKLRAQLAILQSSSDEKRINCYRDINTLCLELDKQIQVLKPGQNKTNEKDVTQNTPLKDLITVIDDIFESLRLLIVRNGKTLQWNHDKEQSLIQSLSLYDTFRLYSIDFLREIDTAQTIVDIKPIFEALNNQTEIPELLIHIDQFNQGEESIETTDTYLLVIRKHFRTIRQLTEKIIKTLNQAASANEEIIKPLGQANSAEEVIDASKEEGKNGNKKGVHPTNLSDFSIERMQASFLMNPNIHAEEIAQQIFNCHPDIRIALSGIPGTGKTTLAKAIAKKVLMLDVGAGRIPRDVYIFPPANSKNSWKDSCEGTITDTFEPLRNTTNPHHPIVILDDMDALGRDADSRLSESKALDPYAEEFPVHIFATINEPEKLEHSLKSRFRIITIAEPTQEQLQKCLKVRLEEGPANFIDDACKQDSFIKNVIALMPGKPTPRQCRQLIEEATTLAYTRPAGQQKLSQDDLLQAVRNMTPTWKTRIQEYIEISKPYAKRVGEAVITAAAIKISLGTLDYLNPYIRRSIIKFVWDTTPIILKFIGQKVIQRK